MATTAYEHLQMKRAVKAVKARWGNTLDMLGPDLQEALTRAEVLAIIAQGATVEDTAQGRLAVLAMQWEGNGR